MVKIGINSSQSKKQFATLIYPLVLILVFTFMNNVRCDPNLESDYEFKKVNPSEEKVKNMVDYLVKRRQEYLHVDEKSQFWACSSYLKEFFSKVEPNDTTLLSNAEKAYVIIATLNSEALFKFKCHKSSTYAYHCSYKKSTEEKKCFKYVQEMYDAAFILNGQLDQKSSNGGCFNFLKKPKNYEISLLDKYQKIQDCQKYF